MQENLKNRVNYFEKYKFDKKIIRGEKIGLRTCDDYFGNVDLKFEHGAFDVLQEHGISETSVSEIREERGESLRHWESAVFDGVTITFE